MKTTAVRLYGKNDLRLETFELPPIRDDEILAHIVSDSICMSSYKAAIQGPDHKRVPKDVATNPIIIGHEFAGEILQVGAKWKDKYRVGSKFSIQPNTGIAQAPGYSYRNVGGNATNIIIHSRMMELGCLLEYKGDAYFYGSLAEPMSCIVGAYHASYHTRPDKYVHDMGIVQGGKMAILAGVGPMGLGAIDYAIHCDRKPSLLIVTDIDDARLARAASILTEAEAKKNGVTLKYVNTAGIADAKAHLLSFTEGHGYDDVFVFAPVRPVVELGDAILGKDGCMNFFAGPTDPNFSALFNFYNVHYGSTHIVGTSGGNTDDMIESIHMMEKGLIDPAAMVTHVGGLDAAAQTTLNLPKIPGGKKLIYTNISMPLTAIADFEAKGKSDPLFRKLAEVAAKHNGLWSLEAERYLLANAKPLPEQPVKA